MEYKDWESKQNEQQTENEISEMLENEYKGINYD